MATAMATAPPMFDSLSDLHRWASDAPPGTSIDAATLAETLADLVESKPVEAAEPDPVPAPLAEWSVRLWSVHPECRLDVGAAAEALGRSKSWIYKRTSPNGDGPRLPHRKLDGALTFTAGELRAWIRDHEESVHEGESWTPGDQRRPRLEVAP